MLHAKGEFDVKIVPQSPTTDASLGRMDLDKSYRGDLVATATGTMLTAMGERKDSAAYVAVERVTGTLNGRTGSFALVHTGLMNQGVRSLNISIAPDSGMGELAGISGTLDIQIEGGKHFYTLDYHMVP